MAYVMLQFKHEKEPTLDEVRRFFHLKAHEIDTVFGVIATDPEHGLYTVLVDPKAGDRIETVLNSRSRDSAEGLFSNPEGIGPFDSPAP